LILKYRSLVTCGEGVRHPTTPICRQSFVLIKIKLFALAFGALIKLGIEVWFWKGCGLDQCFLSVFGIVATFPWRK